MARQPGELYGDPGLPPVLSYGALGKQHAVALRPPHEVHHALRGPLLEEHLGRGLL